MEGLEQQLSQFLSDPNSMKQLQSMMSSLGLGQQQGGGNSGSVPPTPPAPQPAPAPDLSSLAGMLGTLGGGQTTAQPTPAQSLAAPDTLAMVARLAPMLNQLNREDDSTRLLMALRPLLGAERQKKIDEAVKILQLMRLLPMLRDLGGLPGLMPGLG